jgi:hypothetical protein
MHMRREMALDDGARNLITNPIEHASLYTRHGRSLPIERGRVHNDALGECLAGSYAGPLSPAGTLTKDSTVSTLRPRNMAASKRDLNATAVRP